MKTVLVPGAPWPTKVEKKPYRLREVGLKTVRINFEKASLDYFLETEKQLVNYKLASENRKRDANGRFPSRG